MTGEQERSWPGGSIPVVSVATARRRRGHAHGRGPARESGADDGAGPPVTEPPPAL